jgi:RimJ/RimL family protein N-acetyltransferase
MMEEGFTIRPLRVEDARELSEMLLAQSADYARFFNAFSFEHEAIASMLAKRRQDVFMGIYWRGRIAGFFMLRGWDEGYDVPSYGVVIDESYSGYGLTWLSLKMVKSICRLRRVPRLMLKVHPDNLAAKTLFEEAHFIHTGTEAESGNLIYHFNLGEQTKKF